MPEKAADEMDAQYDYREKSVALAVKMAVASKNDEFCIEYDAICRRRRLRQRRLQVDCTIHDEFDTKLAIGRMK